MNETMTRTNVTRVGSFVLCLALLGACGSSADGSAPGTTGAAGKASGGIGGATGGTSGNAAGTNAAGTNAAGTNAAGTNAAGGMGTSQGGSAGGGAVVNAMGECSAFTACGGNLVGRWKILRTCASKAAAKKLGDEIKFCADGSLVATVNASGYVEFDEQGALRFDTVTTAHLVESVPTGCVVAQQDCAGVEGAIAAQDGTTGVTCQATSTGCDCVYDVSSPHRVESSYVINATRYTETNPGDGEKTTSDYCVDGTSLRMSDASAVVELVSSQ